MNESENSAKLDDGREDDMSTAVVPHKSAKYNHCINLRK